MILVEVHKASHNILGLVKHGVINLNGLDAVTTGTSNDQRVIIPSIMIVIRYPFGFGKNPQFKVQ